MRRRWFAWMVVALSVGLAAPAMAEGSQREGFIGGVGLGAGVVSIESTISGADFSETRVGAAIDVDLGWAVTPNLVLQVTDRQLWFQVGGETTMSEVVGAGATYFLSDGPGLLFSGSVGLGLVVQPTSDLEIQRGLGVVAGVGYEFMPHFIAQVDAGWNNPGDFQTFVGLARLKYLYY